MNLDPQTPELRSYFEKLRKADEQHLPPFRIASQLPRDATPWRKALIAAVVLLAVAIASVLLHHRQTQPDMRTVARGPASPARLSEQPLTVSICDWQSPTGFLLETANNWVPSDGFDFFDLGPSSRPSIHSQQS
jgi:hypothetical protein